MRFVGSLVAIVMVAGGAVLWVSAHRESRPQQEPDPAIVTPVPKPNDGKVPVPPPQGAQAATQGERVQAVKNPKDRDKMLAYPDGTYLPVLNGCDIPPRIIWPDEIPYSPVVRRHVDEHGIEYYVHADGSLSSSQMIYRSDLGHKVAMAFVWNPQKAVPRDDLPDSGVEPGKPAAPKPGAAPKSSPGSNFGKD